MSASMGPAPVRLMPRLGMKMSSPPSMRLPENAAAAGLLVPAKAVSVAVTDAPPMPLAFMPMPCGK
jgi:hypothetical protein